jgi:prolyl 4-hydroxylase
MSLNHLSIEWQRWLRENVVRGCSRESLLPLLVQGGHTPVLAERALDEALGEPLPVPIAPSASDLLRPAPLLDANHCLLSDGQRVRIAAVLEAPQLVLYEDLLSADECSALIALAETRLARSTVVDEQLGEARPHEHRSSAGAMFQRGEHALLARIEARLAELLQWPVERGEGMQVLRYGVGGEYRAHFDYFDPALPGSERHLRSGGQRVGSCVMYLADLEAGGATRFPSLGLEMRPRRGGALYFADVDALGRPDAATLHAGAPVQAGVKYIATKWLRQRTYTA